MKNIEIESPQEGESTYCPEDNKLRLYVGRVPKPEYLALREEGWKATPKQDCDFVASWSVRRVDTCHLYAECIDDEDQSPEERAADRAERFEGYLGKRLGEATERADSYDAGPNAFGFQSKAKAVKAADRHDRLADKALDAWGKAEYWQRRTAGVISNALYKSSPSVRAGRIQVIETDMRKVESYYTPCPKTKPIMQGDEGEQIEYSWCGKGRGGHWVKTASLEATEASYARFIEHCKLRLGYENMMLDAAGGMAGVIEMKKGDFYDEMQIHKIHKSPATKRVTSLTVWGRYRNWQFDGPSHKEGLHKVDITRDTGDHYREATAEELEAFKAKQATFKKKASLINPTKEDAQRLQDLVNEGLELENQGEVWEMTQKAYSARAAGDYGPCETRYVKAGGLKRLFSPGKDPAESFCKVRCGGASGYGYKNAERIVVITDKPQKPLPSAIFEAVAETVEA